MSNSFTFKIKFIEVVNELFQGLKKFREEQGLTREILNVNFQKELTIENLDESLLWMFEPENNLILNELYYNRSTFQKTKEMILENLSEDETDNKQIILKNVKNVFRIYILIL